MLRSTHQILENRRGILLRQRRELVGQMAVAETRLIEEKNRYDALARHWHSIGPAAVLTDEDRRVARVNRARAFWRGLALGATCPLTLGLLYILFST